MNVILDFKQVFLVVCSIGNKLVLQATWNNFQLNRNAIEMWLCQRNLTSCVFNFFSFFFTIVGFKLLKESFLTFSTSRFVSVLSHESIMITFYNKLPVLKVIPQNCIAHICTSLLRTTFASFASAYERVHTQHAKRRPFRNGLLAKHK